MVEGQPTRITVTMIPTGVMTGRVLDNGRPVRNVIVRAMRASFVDGERSLSIAEYARSDDLGEYRIFGLAPGIYYVSALPFDRPRLEGDAYVVPSIPSNANGNRSQVRTPAADALAKGLIDATAFDSDMYVPSFFPGTTDETRASPIDVQAGGTVTGIDVTVARSRTVRVRGRVIDSSGQPVQNVSVSVAPRTGRTSNIASAIVDASGRFELPAVPAGRHDLVARTTTLTSRQFGMASVDVTDAVVENVGITIRPGTTLRGKVTIVNAPFGNIPPIIVQLNGAPGTGYTAMRFADDGTFTIENVEAREYRVRVVVRSTFRAPESARFGAEDVTGRVFRFGPEFADTLLDLVLNLAAGGIDVLAADASQRGVSGVTIALVPDAPRRNQSSLFRTASTDEFGRVRFDDVPPGDYLLFTDDVEPQAWQDPEVLRRYETRGTRVRVVQNARQSVTLRVR
jgi:protocatechuate 3,4-dioxygenase beta subunit